MQHMEQKYRPTKGQEKRLEDTTTPVFRWLKNHKIQFTGP